MHFTTLDSVVVKKKLFSLHGGFLTNAMYHHRETIKSKHFDDTKKRAHDSQIVRAKENLRLS